MYGGYFGAGSGVMMMAVLGFGTDLEFRIVNALKTLAVVAANVVASVIFLFVAELELDGRRCSWPPARWSAATSAPGSATTSRRTCSGS